MAPNRIIRKAIIARLTFVAIINVALVACNAFTLHIEDFIAQSQQNSQLIGIFRSNLDSGYSVDFNPDGQTLASGGNRTSKLWNPSIKQLIRTLPGQAWAVAFSPDGQILATGSQDGTLNLWNWRTAKLIRSLSHSSPVIDIAFSSDGQTLASGLDQGSRIQLWNYTTGERIQIPKDPNADKYGYDDFKSQPVAFSPDGKSFVARSSSGSASRLWNLQTGKLIRTFEAKSSINAVAISPDGKFLATGVRDNALKLWNLRTGELISTFTGHSGEVMSVTFSPDSQALASGSWDKTIKLWNLRTGELINTFSGHLDKVWAIAFSPDGKTLASGSQDGTIKIWGVAELK